MSELPHVFVTRRLPGPALDSLFGVCDVEVWPGDVPPGPQILRQRAASADGLLCLLTDPVDGELMDACPRLRVISNLAVGYDNIDLPAAAVRGIAVGHTPGVLTEATADLTFALLLAAARRLPEGMAAVRNGGWGPWSPEWLLGLELNGAVLGIVGMGRIGKAVAARANAFGMEIVYTDENGGSPLSEVLEVADIVSLHCPLTDETQRLINGQTLAQMKRGAILVNTARGGLVEQDAVAEALVNGQLGAAALDVTDPEPLRADDPLLNAPNLIVVPHLGSATRHTREQMAWLAVENIRAGLLGQLLPNPVVVAGGPTAPTRRESGYA